MAFHLVTGFVGDKTWRASIRVPVEIGQVVERRNRDRAPQDSAVERFTFDRNGEIELPAAHRARARRNDTGKRGTFGHANRPLVRMGGKILDRSRVCFRALKDRMYRRDRRDLLIVTVRTGEW